MHCQKYMFQLPDDLHYLNCVYMSPLLKSVEEVGIEGMRRKRKPVTIWPVDFFTGVEEVGKRFGLLVNADPGQVAVMPSISRNRSSVRVEPAFSSPGFNSSGIRCRICRFSENGIQ